MNVLKDKRAYLSGAIEFGVGPNWRIEPSQILKERFGINLFDPFLDPKQQWVSVLADAKKAKDYQTMNKIAKSFVRKDLAMVDRADMLIAFLPYGVVTTGTHHEIINSNNAKKPTLLVTDQNDISFIPTWYFGFIRPEFMFPNWDALFEYLKEVDEGKHRDNNRWSFIYGDI